MEKVKKELSLAELKEQRTELLPDRIELRMRRRGGWTINNQNANANANQQVIFIAAVG